MASHYELYTAAGYNFYFGETSLTPPGYHDAILERRQLRLFAMTEETILGAIREELLRGWYLIFYMKDFMVQDHYHEVLIYGFDDGREKILVAGLKGYTFQEFAVPYAYLRDTLADLKQYFMDDIQQGANLSFHFQSPLTALRLRKDYEAANCPFEAYVKLENELKGDAFTRQTMFGFDDYRENETIYRGINCLYGFMKMLQQEVEGQPFEEWFRGMASGAKKIHEHQRMLRRTMGYLVEKWADAISDQGRSCYQDYCRCCGTAEKWLHMVLKYQQTGEKGRRPGLQKGMVGRGEPETMEKIHEDFIKRASVHLMDSACTMCYGCWRIIMRTSTAMNTLAGSVPPRKTTLQTGNTGLNVMN